MAQGKDRKHKTEGKKMNGTAAGRPEKKGAQGKLRIRNWTVLGKAKVGPQDEKKGHAEGGSKSEGEHMKRMGNGSRGATRKTATTRYGRKEVKKGILSRNWGQLPGRKVIYGSKRAEE